MHTLIINGSPRKNGDTVSLIRKLIPQLPGEVIVIDAYTSGIAGCIDCRYCWKKDGCAVNDPMQQLYPIIEGCDNILIASPVYFSCLTGPLLSIGSRLQRYFAASHFRGEKPIAKAKKGAVLLVGGGNGAPDHAYDTAKSLLRLMGAKDILPMMGSFKTDDLPAVKDEAVLREVDEIAAFFAEETA